MLVTYWVLEAIWVLYYAGAIFAIETGTNLVDGEVMQTAIGLNGFHGAMFAVVLYAMDAKARPQIALGFVVVIITDLQSTLHAAIHLWQTTPGYYWAFVINMTVSSYGLLISLYALVWYFIHLYKHLGSTESANKYQQLHR